MPYSPKPAPQGLGEESRFLWEHMEQELQAISREFSEQIALELRETHVAPTRPREGMIVRADGTDWNPGSGQGLYTYKGTAWVKVGEGISADVVGPSSSLDNEVPRFDLLTGKILQQSGILIDDSKNVQPATSDVGALGTATKMFADLFLALGAVVNFNNGNMTITHAAGKLTIAGGTLEVVDDAYDGTTWNGNVAVPTKNAIRDKIEALTPWVLIDSGSFSAAATKDWTGLSAYRMLRLAIKGARPVTDGVIAEVTFSSDGGTTWTAANIQGGEILVTNSAVVDADGNPQTGDVFHLHRFNNNLVGNAAGEGIWSTFEIEGFNQAAQKNLFSRGSHLTTDSSVQMDVCAGHDDATVAFDGLRFLFSAGNIAAVGTYELWGVKG